MKHARSIVFTALHLLALVAACLTGVARADEYGDVDQLLRAGKLPEALNRADAYLAAKPNDPQMRFLKGVIQRDAGRQSEAIATFTKLTEDYPELPEPYNNLAVLYAGQNQYDKARAALEMAIRTNPSYATAHENLGDVYTQLASQAYRKALQLDNSNAGVQPKLALIRELVNPSVKIQRPAAAAPASTAARPDTAPSAAPVKPAASDDPAREAEAAVRAWAKAWASKDVSAYLGAYGKEFTPAAKQSRSAWEKERRQRIVGKSSISVRLENLTVTLNGNKAVVKFRQNYRADTLTISSRKTLDLLKTGNRWLIVRESTEN